MKNKTQNKLKLILTYMAKVCRNVFLCVVHQITVNSIECASTVHKVTTKMCSRRLQTHLHTYNHSSESYSGVNVRDEKARVKRMIQSDLRFVLSAPLETVTLF